MQKLILRVLLLLMLPIGANAQRLIYNERAPKIEGKEIITGAKAIKDRPTYIDFFVLDSPQNDEQLKMLEKISNIYNNQMNFILISKDSKEELMKFFEGKNPSYTVLLDLDGRTFKNYNIKFIPFSVLIDKKGVFIWQGKNSTITGSILDQVLK
ncbi:MAG: redoxin domain-containing protein [Rikenellaceae bacterium]